MQDEPATTTSTRPTATTPQVSRTTEPRGSASSWPTANPFASATVAADDTETSDWYRACLSAMRLAPLQEPALETRNRGPAVDCAKELALAYADSGTATENSGGAVVMTRDVVYRASVAALTGNCVRTGAVGLVRSADSTPNWCGQPLDPAATPVVIELPNDLVGQSACGQRVDPSAVSAGDLVFWNYRDFDDFAPARVGIALDAGEIVTVETGSGQYVRQAMPTTADMRVKRVLGGIN